MSSPTAELVTVRGTLQDHRVTRESWAVATLLVREVEGEVPFGVAPGVEIAAVGDRLGLAAPGERLELRGTFEGSKFGTQLRVREQVSRGLKEPHEAARWLRRLDGVGPVLARALKLQFGEKLVEVLGDESVDLATVHGIGDETARHIRESFQRLEIAGDLESIQYLDRVKATRWEATKILRWCANRRRKPQEVLEASPFELTAIKGLGFVRVDRLARHAGCAPAAPARIEAGTLHQLGEIVQRGSTVARLTGTRGGGLVGEVSDLLGLGHGLIHVAVRRLAGKGLVVLAEDDRGRTWVHPAWLLARERQIYRAAKGDVGNGIPIGPTPGGSPGALPDQAGVPSPDRAAGDAVPFGGANASECQGGPAGGGVESGDRAETPEVVVDHPPPPVRRGGLVEALALAREQGLGVEALAELALEHEARDGDVAAGEW